MFSVEEEKVFKEHIITSSKLFYVINEEQARKMAYQFAKAKKKDMPKSWEENKTAGIDWMMGFRQKAKNLTL